MTDLTLYTFEHSADHADGINYERAAVRVGIVDGEPVWLAKDICGIVGISKYRDALAQLDPDERVSIAVDTPGGVQQMAGVTEAGVWSLMMISRSPMVKPFKRWLTHEVLPTIRKTGGAYIAPGSQAELDLTNPDTALDKLIEVAQVAKAERARRIALEERIEADRPMVERAKTHATAAGEKTRQQFFREVKQWAHDNHGVEVKQAQVVKFLSTSKLGIFVRGNRSDAGQATAWAIEKGYAVNREDTALNGHNYVTGKLTARGQQYAWDRIFRFIDANGHLDLPREIGGAA